jgi:GH25 family lysozyme M1 (1,4-beta-N-acetylmuramidase)
MARRTKGWKVRLAAFVLAAALPASALASDFSMPWKRKDRALVIDAYEYNAIDWHKLVTDKSVVGFIGKASDGLPPPWACSGDETAVRLCKALFKRHAVARELFQTRRTIAKALGLKWGAYHLARPGNPIDQANNFIDFADPAPDDLMAIDIEDNDPKNWMSLADAEEFVRHIHRRVGRFPLLYTNGVTAKHIAQNRDLYPLLSRLPLWYARYKPEIGEHFPKGNWRSYTLWQFSSQANCSHRRCPYRVPGTPNDIDVNVASMDADALREAWPFGGLVDAPADLLVSVPVPVRRELGLAGNVTIAYADVAFPQSLGILADAYRAAAYRVASLATRPSAEKQPPESRMPANQSVGLAEYLAKLKDIELAYRAAYASMAVEIDLMPTASIAPAPIVPEIDVGASPY